MRRDINLLKIGKREKNKAEQKIEIMKAFVSAMHDKELHELKVEDICKDIAISKVTFFNYFSSKEEVIQYFVSLWEFDMSYMIEEKELEGTAILYFIFDYIGAHPATRQLINAIMMYFIKSTTPTRIDISDYELYLFNSEAYERGIVRLSLLELIQRSITSIKIADEKKEGLISTIVAGFYGVAFIQNMNRDADLNLSYKAFLDRILA